MIITVIVGVFWLLVAGFALYRVISNADNAGQPDQPSAKPWVMVAILLGVLTFASLGFRIIPAGSVGVVTWFGEVEDRTLQPGLQFIVPVVEGIEEVNTRVQAINFENLAAASLEYQDVFITGTLNIHVDGTQAGELYQDVGLDYIEKIISPFLATFIKQVVPEYEIDSILGKREEIRLRAAEMLGLNLAKYHIVVDDLAFAQISFSPEYTKAIEDKQVQEQRVLTERQILEQRRIQAEQQIASAHGDAESTIERARGQAEANRLLSASLTPNLIQWQAIQRLNDKIQVIMLPSNDNFLFDARGLLPQE